ncbi:MAG TPA: response regulator, partial [Chloroflexota bacterium]|nr:response regulator [Chloroflexota bacterium]
MKAILVVEDDQATRLLLRDTLSEVEGWVVTVVEDGAKALEALNSVQPHLIVLDVNMPGLDGLAVYRLLRERANLAEVPVLFVTA